MILPLLPDPTDIIVQNEMTVFGVTYPMALYDAVCPMGEDVVPDVNDVPPIVIPRGMVGQHEWYGLKPRKLGPYTLQPSGEIAFFDVGDPAQPIVVEPVTGWLAQNLGKQVAGYDSIGPEIIGPSEASNSFVVSADDPLDDTEKIQLPRRALVMSGNLSARRVFPRMPASFYGKLTAEPFFTESTSKWIISGQTLDKDGVALPNCTVYLLRTDRLVLSVDAFANPIIDIEVSDASGNYSFQVATPVDYQVIAYLPGSPDVAGVTRHDVQATVV